jgi:hypothetical protein
LQPAAQFAFERFSKRDPDIGRKSSRMKDLFRIAHFPALGLDQTSNLNINPAA